MSAVHMAVAPLLAWPVLAVLGVICAVAVAASLVSRARGGVLRAAGFLLLFGVLLGPLLVRETTRPLPDIFAVAVDRSQSMSIGNRAALADAALAGLQAQAAAMAGLQLRVVDVPAADGGGTALFAALRAALGDIPAGQLAGVAAITDGQISDAPAGLPFDAPFSALLTGAAEETDRELRLISAPEYGLAGKTVSLQLEVFDDGATDAGAPADIGVTEDGDTVWRGAAAVGVPMTVDIPVRHAGPAVVAASVAPLAGEVSPINDQAAFTLNGVARKLEVVLISGYPNQGERSWRLLLKSDPAVELVHFTILRTPDEVLDAPPEAVALVPFPVQQLFETDISKFDLIILDQFDSSGLLPPQYLGNIADYVRGGGALLVQVGPEFSGADSLALTPLAPVLPATPSPPGTLAEKFAPAVTDIGARDPVTAPFAGTALSPWERLEAAAPTTGDVLMTGTAANWPLLILANEGAGRVGMLLSDQFWLWTRGGAHDGPAVPLLRRVVHWLLREPALEAEALNARIDNGQLQVRRQTLGAATPGDATVTAPDGVARTLALRVISPGVYGASLPAATPGVWKVSEGGKTTYAALGESNTEEYQDLAATAGILRPLGTTVWLGRTPHPDLAAMLRRRGATAVTGTRDVPLLPPLPAMILAVGLLAAAWWRERGAS
jgi:hypothetical protein